VLLVVGLGTFLGAAQGSTVNLALPDIGRDLGIAIDLTGWVVSAFLLAVTVLLLVAGRASDLLGHRKVYLVGQLLFGLASLVAGLCDGIGTLIAARLVQGCGGAMVMATGPALLTTSFPPSQRGRALGMLATATYTGLTIGPPIGGWIVAQFSWRWVFFLNLPVALLITALGWLYLPRAVRRRAVPFDWGGAAALVLGLPLLLVALAQGERWGWGSELTLTCAAAGGLLVALFVILQRRGSSPLLDFGLFRSRVFTGAVLSALGNYVALFIPIILLPFYLIEALDVTPSRAGLLLSAQPIMMAVVTSPSGRLSDRIGSRGLATGGLLVLAVGLAGLATVGPTTSTFVVAAWLAVMGLGTGIFISPNSSALMGAAPPAQQGVAGSVMAVARSLGMIIGVAAATSIYVAAGGQTGRAWIAADYQALRVALWVAAGVSVASAVAAALRGGHSRRDTSTG
jgi:EmrB/QacA subfamily drug resistance transporter